MGRPAMPPGTFGKIHFLAPGSGQVEARTRIRDFDGRVRLVSRRGPSRAAAERSLRAELAARRQPSAGGAVTGPSRVELLATVWLERPHAWSSSTERLYRSVVKNHVVPAVGQLRVQEVTPGVVSRIVAAAAGSSGPGIARTMRACLSGMFAVAVEDGALAANPVRDSATRISSPKKAARALTRAETGRLVELIAASERARALDLPDLVDFMLATGCRIGEALAARQDLNVDGRPLLDLQAGTWEVNSTVVRIASEGLVLQDRPKSAAGWRVIALPPFAGRLLERRGTRGAMDLVFAAPISTGLRDPSNVSGDLRRLLDSFECQECNATGYRLRPDGEFETGERGQTLRCDAGPWSWVSSHTFRKTVATRLDEAGFSPRQVADQLGHANPSMTLDVYFGRHVVSAAAASALDRAG